MAALGYFDTSLCGACWFDPLVAEARAWFDTDLILCAEQAIEVPAPEERGAWSEYRRRSKRRRTPEELTWLEFEPDGGLEFGGAAICRWSNVALIVRRLIIPRGGLRAQVGSAMVERGGWSAAQFLGGGDIAALSGAALLELANTETDNGLPHLPDGGLASMAGDALVERHLRHKLRLVA